jgi:outer membrane protein, heavy metal efflux system
VKIDLCLRRGWRPLQRLCAALLPAMILSSSVRAQELPGADLASIEAWISAHNPELRIRAIDAQAADARIQPAGALPDPMMSVEFRDIDIDRPRVLPAQVGNTLYQVRQRFPLWGKRDLAREVAREEASASLLMRDATALELQADASAAYVRYWHAGASVQVVERMITLLEDLQRLAETRYGAGLAPQQDAIKAQVESTVMRRDLIERRAMGREAAAMLNTLLAREPDAPLAPPLGVPALPVTARLQDILDAIPGQHPMVQAQSHMVVANDRMAEMVRRERYPDINVGLGLMQSGNRLASWELMVEVEIPFQQTARRHRERAALLVRDSALARQDAIEIELRGRVGAAWARWQSALDQRRLIESPLLPQAEASFRSALASYQVGAVDFGTLLEALRQWLGARLDQVDAQRDELTAAAQVRAIQGEIQ